MVAILTGSEMQYYRKCSLFRLIKLVLILDLKRPYLFYITFRQVTLKMTDLE